MLTDPIARWSMSAACYDSRPPLLLRFERDRPAMAGNCVTYVQLWALVRSDESSRSEESAVIGTLLIIWLGLVPAIWLVWVVSRVPALLVGLGARIRR
jgi:hypothetical protein